MARRLDKTPADYAAIAPALIMLLVSSLVLFLTEVFYQGHYNARLCFILVAFVFAAVLIGRISIEEGAERAALFAVPLAIAVSLAMNRFVSGYGGPMAGWSWLVNLALVGVIWWCAHKLTWDCTLIDEEHDASGEGLLQTVGLEESLGTEAPDSTAAGNHCRVANATENIGGEDEDEDSDDVEEAEGTTSRDRTAWDATPGAWRERLQDPPRRAAHTPGKWVVYFSLAALPIFGVGQLLIPAASLPRRQYVFWLLALYVAAGLALLVTTSFLGLRRYLRQRRIEMPTKMAGAWLGGGAAMILVLLTLVALAPRPNAEFPIASLTGMIDSPKLASSRHSVGGEGADRDPPDGDDNSKSTSGDREGKPSETATRGEGGKPRGQGDEPRDSNSQGNGASNQGETDHRRGGSGQTSDKQEGDSAQQGGDNGSKRGGESSKGSQTDPTDGDDEGGQTDSSGEQGSGDDSTEQDQGATDNSGGASNDENASRSDNDRQGDAQGDADRASDSSATPNSSSTSDSSGGDSFWSKAAQWLALLMKLAVYALLLAIAGFLLWRYWDDVRAALAGVLAELRELWNRLFGGGGEADGALSADEVAALQKPALTFADFPDPFATGRASRFSPEELVAYSFHAMEAWASDHGCPRSLEQTPAEFAQTLASRAEPISAEVFYLADLYAQVAYAPGKLPPTSDAQLRSFWRRLRPRGAA